VLTQDTSTSSNPPAKKQKGEAPTLALSWAGVKTKLKN
jgi:hypothetical protein